VLIYLSIVLVRAGKEVSAMARKALVRIARLLQHVFNETGMEEATSPDMYQNFIRSCIPQFHSTIRLITETAPPRPPPPSYSLTRPLGGPEAE
jgi:hypothetical protein